MKMKVNADLKTENQGKVKFFYLSDEIEGATKAEIIETAYNIITVKRTSHCTIGGNQYE